jgi:tetratricopeptide (TPR) repeat protein
VRERLANVRAIRLRADGDYAGAAAVLREAIALDPEVVELHFNLGQTSSDVGAWDEAERAFKRVVELDPENSDAYRALADLAQVRGDVPAALAYQGQALSRRRLYSRIAPRERRRVLGLYAPGDFKANAPIELMLDPETTTLHTYYCTERSDVAELPEADVAFVTIGESPWAEEPLRVATRLLRETGLPVVNQPSRVMATNRERLARTVADIPALTMPNVATTDRESLRTNPPPFPLVVRPPGSQAGERFERIESRAGLDAYLAANADAEFFVSPFVDYANADGFYRKYRVVLVDGEPFGYHLAIAPTWKVHYYMTPMEHEQWMRNEEEAFLRNGNDGKTDALFAALRVLASRLQLDYFAADCTIGPDGMPLLFEADTAMLVHAIDPTKTFAYKDGYIRRIFAAVEALLDRRAKPTS